MKWVKLKTGNWMGYSGKYYVFLRIRKHYVREGFDKFQSWWTALIGTNGWWKMAEGVFGSHLSTLPKAKKWAENKVKSLNPNT